MNLCLVQHLTLLTKSKKGNHMEKLKLSNGTEFNLIPMGIAETEKTRGFKLTAEQDINTVLDLVSNPDNFASVQISGASGDTLKIYQDITSFAGLSLDKDVQVEDNTTADVYTIKYRTDAAETKIKALEQEVTILKDTVDALVLSNQVEG